MGLISRVIGLILGAKVAPPSELTFPSVPAVSVPSPPSASASLMVPSKKAAFDESREDIDSMKTFLKNRAKMTTKSSKQLAFKLCAELDISLDRLVQMH